MESGIKTSTTYVCVSCGSDVNRIYKPNKGKDILCFKCSRLKHKRNYVDINRSIIYLKTKERQEKNLSEGKCRCGKDLIEGLKYCEKCRTRQINTKRANKEVGMCNLCGKFPPIEGRVRCISCTERQRLAQVKSRNKKITL